MKDLKRTEKHKEKITQKYRGARKKIPDETILKHERLEHRDIDTWGEGAANNTHTYSSSYMQ